MFLVVGLGNPGPKYAHNRHNIGFLAADRVARQLNAGPWSRKFQGEIAEGKWPETKPSATKIYLLKPQTYMNLSGESVGACARFYKIPPENIIVLYDELDLLPGKLRVKRAGGDGGHNGIRSIDAHMGKDYERVRIGIGHPGDKALVTHYVLGDFGKAEWELQERMLDAVARHFPLLLAKDAPGFMNKVALEVRVESPESSK